MRLESTAVSTAAVSVVWEAIADINSWSSNCREIQLSETSGPLAVGAHVRLATARMRTAMWTVLDIAVEHRLALRTDGPGYSITAEYIVEHTGSDTGCTVQLSRTFSGPMAWAVLLIARRSTRLMMRQHALRLAASTPRRSGDER